MGSVPSAGDFLRQRSEEAGGDQEGHCHLLVTLPRTHVLQELGGAGHTSTYLLLSPPRELGGKSP